MLLRDVCEVRSGYTARGRLESVESGILAIQQGEISVDGRVDLGAALRVDPSLGKYALKSGDILFRSRGQHNTCSVVPEDLDEPAIAIMPLFILRPSLERADPHYLAWILNQSEAQRHIQMGARGTNIQMVSKPVLESTPVVMPPLARQRRIAFLADLESRERTLSHSLIDHKHALFMLQMNEVARTDCTPMPTKIHDRTDP